MIKKITHVAIATRSIAAMAKFYEMMGLEVSTLEVIKDQKVRVAMMKIGDSAVELIEATEAGSPVARFIEKHGEGIHHVSFEVDNLQQQLDSLKKEKVKLVDEKPRRGAQGHLIAFVHPDSTGGVLVELSQPGPGDRP